MKRITSLDTLRFFSAIFIVLFHSKVRILGHNEFACGGLAVELFFVLSGFLLAKTCKKRIKDKKTPEQKCQTYCIDHFIRLWPEYLFAMIISIILLSVFAKTRLQPLGLNIIMMGGIGGIPHILNASWYVSVVFYVGCFLATILILLKDKAKLLVFPILFFTCLFCMINDKSPFIKPYDVVGLGVLSKGMIRGCLGMIVGIYTWWICEKLPRYKDKLNNRFIPVVLFACEVISVGALFHMFTFQSSHSMRDFNVYFYISFLISLLYFKKEKLLKFMSWKFWAPFSKISYMLYLTHSIVLVILAEHYKYFMRSDIIRGYIICVLLSLMFAFYSYCIFDWLRNKIKKLVFNKDF